MRKRNFVSLGVVFGSIAMILSGVCGKQIKPEQGRVKDEVTIGMEQYVQSDRGSTRVLLSDQDVSGNLLAKVKLPMTNKELTKKEAYVNWEWKAVKDGAMKGVRTCVNSKGKETAKKVRVKSSYVNDGIPVAKMYETGNGQLYFLCNTYQEHKINYLVTSSSGKELRGGKLDLKELLKKEDGSLNKNLWFTDMVVSGTKIIVGYQSRKDFTSLENPKCGILSINTKTGKWTSKELDPDKWMGMELHGDAVYSMPDDKSIVLMKYDTGEEMVIHLPDIVIPESVYEGIPVSVGSVAYLDNRVYLLDVHGNLYVCDLNGSGTFELISTDGCYSYPAYSLDRIQVSGDGKSLYAAFWEGGDECYPEDYKPWHWVKYNIG